MGGTGVGSSPLRNPSARMPTYRSRLQARDSNARRIHPVQISLFNSAIVVTFHGEAFPSFSLWRVSAVAHHALAIGSRLVVFPLGFPRRHICIGRGFWSFSPLPGESSAAITALLADALRHFILLTADCLGDRY